MLWAISRASRVGQPCPLCLFSLDALQAVIYRMKIQIEFHVWAGMVELEEKDAASCRRALDYSGLDVWWLSQPSLGKEE